MELPRDRNSLGPNVRTPLPLYAASASMKHFVHQVTKDREPVRVILTGPNRTEIQAVCEYAAGGDYASYRTTTGILPSGTGVTKLRVVYTEDALQYDLIRQMLDDPHPDIKTFIFTKSVEDLDEQFRLIAKPYSGRSDATSVMDNINAFRQLMGQPLTWPTWASRQVDHDAIIDHIVSNMNRPNGMEAPRYDDSARAVLTNPNVVRGVDDVKILAKKAHRVAVQEFRRLSNEHPHVRIPPYVVTSATLLIARSPEFAESPAA